MTHRAGALFACRRLPAELGDFVAKFVRRDTKTKNHPIGVPNRERSANFQPENFVLGGQCVRGSFSYEDED